MSRVFFLLLPMLKNVDSQIGQGSQNGPKKTPDISHLTGIAKSFHFKKSKKIMPKPKRRFRLIYQQATDCWYFIEMPFGLYWGCVKANMEPEHSKLNQL